MKKFLFLLLSLAVVTGANAAHYSKLAQKSQVISFNASHVIQSHQTPKAPVTQAPEGQLKTYNVSGDAVYIEGGYLTAGEQDGTIDLIFADDNKVWFKNILYSSGDNYGDSYVYGTLSADGSTITVPMGQSIFYSDSYSADIVLAWGTTVVEGTSISFVVDENVTEAVFAVNGNTIALQNSAAAPSGSDYPQYEGTGIGCYWTDDNSFGGLLNWNTVLTEAEVIVDPSNVTAEPTATTAVINAVGEQETYNIRYRKVTEGGFFEDFESLTTTGDNPNNGWTTIDSDGDGYSWYAWVPASTGNGTTDNQGNPTVFGNACLTSASYQSVALTPDNWLISPQVELGGNLSLWYRGQDPSWASEVFAVYVSTGDPTDLSSFVELVPDMTAGQVYQELVADLSLFEGEMGYIAIRHHNVTDMFRLNIDNVTIGTTPEEWIVVEGVTLPYTIEGLDPETTYEVQVQGVVDAQTTTNWTESTQFTTLAETVVPEISELYVVGSFNGWNTTAEGGRIELVENEDGTEYTGQVELEAGAEFKVITFNAEGNTIWFGGIDETQSGHFLINAGLLGVDINLIDGANFMVEDAGKYNITVMEPVDDRALQEPLVMIVTKEATAISTVGVDTKADNRIFDIMGRELKSVPENGIYIQNGKKYVK
jgi:hypothetical protein